MPLVATSPLSQRIAVLERHWLTFRRQPQSRLCRWVFAPGEEWLLLQFLQEQAGDKAVSNDIFITLSSPLQSWQAYLEQVLLELKERVQHDQELLNQHGFSLAVSVDENRGNLDAVSKMVQYLHQFTRKLRAYTDGALVICLLPDPVNPETSLEPALTALLQSDWPPNLYLLVTDTVGAEQLVKLCNRFKTDCFSSTIDLQLQKVTRQLAALGSPTAPDVKFRQWHAELTNALSQQNLHDVLYFANNCLLICGQENWMTLGGSVQLSVAFAYANHHQFEEALNRYNQVIEQMEGLYREGNVPAGQLSIMAWLGGAGVYSDLRQRQQAIDYFQRATDRAEVLQDWLLAVESCRRLSLAHTQSGQKKMAEAGYQRLFDLAKNLPPAQHGTARLPEIGKLYWQQQSTAAGRYEADQRLAQLLGPNWRRKSGKS